MSKSRKYSSKRGNRRYRKTYKKGGENTPQNLSIKTNDDVSALFSSSANSPSAASASSAESIESIKRVVPGTIDRLTFPTPEEDIFEEARDNLKKNEKNRENMEKDLSKYGEEISIFEEEPSNKVCNTVGCNIMGGRKTYRKGRKIMGGRKSYKKSQNKRKSYKKGRK
jgi:hypothetical protein